jgi:hypothetical protein
MSRQRHIVVLTQAQYSVIEHACRYVVDCAFVPQDATDGSSEGQGDITRQRVRAIESSLAAYFTKPRDIDADCGALCAVIQAAIESSCNCISREGAINKGAHDRDCWVTRHRRELNRALALHTLLKDAL